MTVGAVQAAMACSRRARHGAVLAAAFIAFLVVPQVGQAQQGSASTQASVMGGETVLRGDFTKATESLSAELDTAGISDDRRAGLLNDRGVAHWRLGDLSAALDDFNKAATYYPELAAVYNNRGNVLLALQSPTEALRDFDRAVLLAPSYAAAYNNRAIAEVQLEKLDAATADFAQAAILAPTAPAPINGRGKVHLDLGRPYLALRDFSRAIAIEPSYRPAYRNRALARIAMHQYGVAIDDLTNALTFAPNDPGLLLTRGLAEIGAQNPQAALADLDKLVAATPKSPQALAERGHARAMLGSFPEAMNDFSKAIELEPKNRDAYVYRAQAHLANGEADLGLADAERALRIDPRFGVAYRARASIEEALGQKAGASADFEQAAGFDPDDGEAWSGLKRLSGKDRASPDMLPGAPLSGWRIVNSGARLVAVSDRLADLRVPLELVGTESTELTGWEEKGQPFKGIGILRYAGGEVATGQTREKTEFAVIIDIVHRQIVGIEPYRIGDKPASWTWTDGGELIVKGSDGVSSNYRLGEALTAQQLGSSLASNRGSFQTQARQTSAPPPRKKKGFALFDFLFN
jgi:tetratricopeptide (TPR) repeat protein